MNLRKHDNIAFNAWELHSELLEIRVLMDENPSKAKQKLTNFLKNIPNLIKEEEEYDDPYEGWSNGCPVMRFDKKEQGGEE